MAEDLPSTPEGRLIRRVRELMTPKLTIRAAAGEIGMSPEQWGYAERGYLPSRGGNPAQEFHPPAATLARMAASLGIPPARLRSEGGPRGAEAADLLESEGQRSGAAGRQVLERPRLPEPQPMPALAPPGSDRTALDPFITSVKSDLWDAGNRHGPAFTGEQAFSDGTAFGAQESRIWDTWPRETEEEVDKVVQQIAVFRYYRAEMGHPLPNHPELRVPRARKRGTALWRI